MRRSCALVFTVWAVTASGQTLTNQSLSGKYWFRQVSLATDSAGAVTDARSVLGSITFNGTGGFSWSGQVVIGTGAATSQTGSGKYTVDAGGLVSMPSPLRSGDTENARFGPEGLVASSTESADNAFDILVAIPAPANGATFSGSYWAASLEFPGGTAANARSAILQMTTGASGTLTNISVNGHAANLNAGAPLTQQVTGATYTVAGDGTGAFSFGAANTANLLSGNKTLYVSADGNLVLGGSTAAGSHDIVVGVKAVSGASQSTWNATFWTAGLRVKSTDSAPEQSYAGAVVARGLGNLTTTRRIKALGSGAIDATTVAPYSLAANGSGTLPLAQVALGASGKAFVTAAIAPEDPQAFELDFGVQVASLSGSGVFLSPLGIVNAASSAPAAPISPGEFLTLYGSGLAKSNATAAPPYPTGGLNGVTVLINGKSAPLYFVSAGQINCLVPYSTSGPTATILVQNGAASSNTVTVPVAATSPGIYSVDQSGTGAGAILHADFTLVTPTKPALPGETVLVFLTGLGSVNPAVNDGTAPSGLTSTNVQPEVLIGGLPGDVAFSGLAPGFPGLYQINVTLPAFPPGAGAALPLAIIAGNAYHDQVNIPIL
ncbi:MAG TPA: IPT/TIG domain-containing protein [Candidatus Limnocylindrales bacterium]|nr:IPT/TIG domain-containing protein [Candidatus Limnocylindrales bacterium]